MRKQIQIILPVVVTICVWSACLFPFAADASDRNIQPVRSRLDTETIRRGFTLETADQEFRLGVTPNAVGERKQVHAAIKNGDIREVETQGEVLLSRIYSFDIFHKNTVEVFQPIWISVKWDVESTAGYALKYWDGNQKMWIEIPSTVNYSEGRVQAAIHLPYAIVAVFQDDTIEYSGQASWMDWHGAAMNDVEIGTEVLVENPDTGATATTTVLSTGPFVEGRIIDLPRSIFASIGDVAQGVISVIVRPLNS